MKKRSAKERRTRTAPDTQSILRQVQKALAVAGLVSLLEATAVMLDRPEDSP